MTGLQLYKRLCSAWLTVQTGSQIDVEHQMLIVDAISRGFSRFFSLCPVRYRVKPWSGRFNVSTAGTCTVTAGSTLVTAVAGVTPVDGASVYVGDDDLENRIYVDAAGAYRLDMEYNGTTGSGKTLTVHRDVRVLPWQVGSFVSPLRHATTKRLFQEVPPGADWSATDAYPYGFRIEQWGSSQVIRALPLPDAALPAVADIEIAGLASFGIGMLTDTTGDALPASDLHIINLISPLIAGYLITHPLWKTDGMRQVALAQSADAVADIALLAHRAGPGGSRIIPGDD